MISLNGHVSNTSAISLWKRNRIHYWITVAQVTGGRLSPCLDGFFRMPQNQTFTWRGRDCLTEPSNVSDVLMLLSEAVDLKETNNCHQSEGKMKTLLYFTI